MTPRAMMQVAAITGPREAALVERPRPAAKRDFAVVRVLVTPMCTEYKMYRDGNRSDGLGHEAAGEVVEVAQDGAVRVGDRVVVMPQFSCGGCALCLAGDYIHCERCRDVRAETGNETGWATYAQYLVKQDWLLLPVPEGLSLEHASMACCGLGPTFAAMERMRVDRLDTVMITGMGPVGLGGVIQAAYRGARVIAVEGHPYRARLARELGAALVVDPADERALAAVRDFTGGRGVDKGADCSGSPQAQRLLIDAARRRGQVCFVGEGGDLTVRVSDDMIRKGISLHGVWHWNRTLAPRMMQTIADCADPIARLITHRFPMGRVKEAWELQMTGNCGKVLLDPSKT